MISLGIHLEIIFINLYLCECDGNNLVAESIYTYDQFGHLTDLIHTGVATYGWIYDQANRITSFTSPDGVAVYEYDDH